MGLLTGRPLPDWHPAPPDLQYACVRAAAHCRARGRDLRRWRCNGRSTAARRRRHRDATPRCRHGEPEDVRRNVAAAEAGPLDPALLAEVSDLLAPVHNVSWPSGRRKTTPDPPAAPQKSGPLRLFTLWFTVPATPCTRRPCNLGA
jgi:L-galactose dehydrogenase